MQTRQKEKLEGIIDFGVGLLGGQEVPKKEEN